MWRDNHRTHTRRLHSHQPVCLHAFPSRSLTSGTAASMPSSSSTPSATSASPCSTSVGMSSWRVTALHRQHVKQQLLVPEQCSWYLDNATTVSFSHAVWMMAPSLPLQHMVKVHNKQQQQQQPAAITCNATACTFHGMANSQAAMTQKPQRHFTAITHLSFPAAEIF